MKEEIKKVYILETNKEIKGYSQIEDLRLMLKVDYIYFRYSDKILLREATEIEKQMILELKYFSDERNIEYGIKIK